MMTDLTQTLSKLNEEIFSLKKSIEKAKAFESELDRRVYHLKTLYDVSRDLFSCVDSDEILRNFLLMSMGNFGVAEGFIIYSGGEGREFFESIGLDEQQEALLKTLVTSWESSAQAMEHLKLQRPWMGGSTQCFELGNDWGGLIALGEKLIEEPFNEDDLELLKTLVNNLTVALANAASFEKIQKLNQHLCERNAELSAALRKVEILEAVKSSLSKFVPNTVCQLIECSPTGEVPQSREQDISVLFLDVQGYTALCELLGGQKVGQLIERCFSVFMNAIYANDGDVNETAGDGLMVLFVDVNEQQNAVKAVRTALAIREQAKKVREEFTDLPLPLAINMGINSGTALLGAARFDTYSGSRWTYTARGSVTNVAARLGGKATNGQIVISETTAARVNGIYQTTEIGTLELKNVSVPVKAFGL